MNDQSTKRPWKQFKHAVATSNDGQICICDKECNAKLIVKSVNCHDELIICLQQAKSVLNTYINGWNPHPITKEIIYTQYVIGANESLDSINKALLKAQAEQ